MERYRRNHYGPLHLLRDIALAPVLVVIWAIEKVTDN